MITAIVIIIFILLVWLSSELKTAEQAYVDKFSVAGLVPSTNQYIMGVFNKPMQKVYLDNGFCASKDEDGKFVFRKTAKFGLEYM